MQIKTSAPRLNSPECIKLLGHVVHMAAHTSNGVRVVLRQHTKGFSRTILRENTSHKLWETIEHKEYLSEEV